MRGAHGRALDLGVEGVMWPAGRTRWARAAEAWASALTTADRARGARSISSRRAGYGTEPDAIEHARARTLGVAQIESPEAVEAVEEIASVEGIDVLFVGPSDLSVLDGRFRQFDDPGFRSAIERVVAAARATPTKSQGSSAAPPDEVPAAIADGFRMIGIGSDGGYMMRTARQTLEAAREATKLA